MHMQLTQGTLGLVVYSVYFRISLKRGERLVPEFKGRGKSKSKGGNPILNKYKKQLKLHN